MLAMSKIQNTTCLVINVVATSTTQFSESVEYFPKLICTTVNFSLLSCTLVPLETKTFSHLQISQSFQLHPKHII